MTALKGKVAIVTGASSGIGRATALLYAREGASVIITARRRDELEKLVREIEADGNRAIAHAGDVRDEDHAAALVALAVQEFGGLDIALNNAGIAGNATPVTELAQDDWSEIIATNLTSAFLGAKHQLPAMRKRGGGSLIFTSSFVGHATGFPGMAAYSAAKAGLVGLVRSIAAEAGPEGIRANALLAGGVDTQANIANSEDAGPEVREFVENIHALKRLAQPEEIACAALYLASAASSFTTGSAMLVDGGASIMKT